LTDQNAIRIGKGEREREIKKTENEERNVSSMKCVYEVKQMYIWTYM
jgi:hypothetical protein